jgi:sigma-E factor negative regulatory protein RseC
MEIIGTVVAVDGNMAEVVVRRVSACGENCANCKGSCETTTAKTVAENLAGAGVGDLVKIESESSAVIRAALILYMIPIAVTILLAALFYGLDFDNLYVILFSVIGFFASFFAIKCFDKKIAPKSYITKVLGKGVK